MESDQFSADVCPHPHTNRTTQFLIQSLLTILSLNIYAAPTATIQQKLIPVLNQTTFSPIPIRLTTMFTNLAAAASTVVTERVVVSTVSSAERRQNVAWFAESQTERGFRYSRGSSSTSEGFDCSGFVRYVLTYFDIKSSRSSSDLFREGTQIPVSSARSGDLVFFGSKNNISHVAMVISNDEKGLVVVHSTNARGVVKENITESTYWKTKLKDKAVNIIGL
jgi:cell wall-associated NlpC family hydrolase